MKKICVFLILAVLCACSSPWEHKGAIKLEFRAAQMVPAEGLKEMEMYKTEDIFYVYDQVLISKDDISSAVYTTWQGHPGIKLTMTESGRKKWAQATEQNIDDHIAMILDDILVCAPLVMAKIDVGIAVIQGMFTEKEAQIIAEGLFRD